MKILLKRKYWW